MSYEYVSDVLKVVFVNTFHIQVYGQRRSRDVNFVQDSLWLTQNYCNTVNGKCHTWTVNLVPSWGSSTHMLTMKGMHNL